jgi:hypothetical protein
MSDCVIWANASYGEWVMGNAAASEQFGTRRPVHCSNWANGALPRYACAVIRADRVLPGVLAEVIRKAPLCPEKVDFSWRAAVGSAVDRVTRVRLDESGVLHVTATDPQWAREVKRSSPLILSRLATFLGKGTVKRIHVR